MKYIRTKDGRIYEIIDETENSFELCGSFEKKMGCNCIMIKRMFGNNEKPTYRLTDTIEELCDFVDIQFDDGTWETYSYENEFKIKLLFKKAKQVFYGIRVDKGLIYVAKMNDKGVMELL